MRLPILKVLSVNDTFQYVLGEILVSNIHVEPEESITVFIVRNEYLINIFFDPFYFRSRNIDPQYLQVMPFLLVGCKNFQTHFHQ